MAEKLTDTLVENLTLPPKGNKIIYDTSVKGFGIRVTAGGARAFVLNYRTSSGRERRKTIGQYPNWKTVAARNEAKGLKRLIDTGIDPLAVLEAERNAKTMADLCERFREEHLPKKRPATARDYSALIDRHILPAFKHTKVAEIDFADIDGLHRKISRGYGTGGKEYAPAPYAANRAVAVLSKMFALAIRWRWCSDNPAKGIERNHEEKRHRYLSPAELAELTKALADLEDQQAANIIRLLLLTGARRGEVQSAKWADLDLEAGVWTKPGSTTKQKTTHRVPLSAPARLLLADIHADAEAKAKDKKRPRPMSDYVFPSHGERGHREEIKKAWREVCVAAGIVTVETVNDAKGNERTTIKPSARIHDLRHTYASLLASAGLSLPIIGALLGHSQPATTARYSHLMDDPLRQATDRVGAIVMPSSESADVVPLKGAQ